MKKLLIPILIVFHSVLINAQLPQISLVQLGTSGYAKPLDIKTCGDQRLFIVEQTGYIRILYKNGAKQTTPFLDIDARVNSTGDEQGLLGLAFSPNYKQDGYFYVNYINGSGAGSTRISRFSAMANDSTQADPNSEVILLTFTQPYTNHNGGNMMFGPDGYLYVSQGDGGSGNDPQGYGQNKNSFLGKMLRLDVTGQTSYIVPPTNPFVGVPSTKPEIWAYGLRNPWRCSFDRLTGDMWIGDVGQNDWEEIDFQDASSVGGENYGWRCREGFHQCPGCNQTGCTGIGYTDPVYEVAQGGGTSCSITGGYVYRGTQHGKLFGLYFFTDYCSGNFWCIQRTGINTFVPNQLVASPVFSFQMTSFGQDNLGELYVAYRGSGSNGRIYRFVETSNCNPVAFISLNDTIEGCKPVTISALRGDTLSYQWYSSSGVIGGATSYQYAAQQSGWYKVKVSKQQAGCEAMSDSVYVNAFDSTALAVSNPTLATCTNSPALNLNSNITPTGGIFSGTGVSGTDFISTLGNIGNNAIHYSYINSSGCSSGINFSVVLNDTTPIIQDSQNTLICINESPFSLNAYLSPVGGNYSGNGVIGNSFHPSTAGLGTSSITYSYINGVGCESRSEFAIEVGDESALIGNITDSIYCDNESAFSLNGLVTPVGGFFAGTGVIANNFDPAIANLGTNVIVYLYANNFGCNSSLSFNLEVGDATTLLENISDSVFCIYDSPVLFDAYVSPTGGIFSGNGMSGNSFDPAAANIGNNPITYSYTNLAGCNSEVIFTAFVIDTSIITRNSTDTLVCITEPSFIMNNYTSPVGGNFSGNGIANNSFNASVAGTGVSAITYTYTNVAGCESRYTFNLEVGSETVLVVSIVDSVYCNNESVFSLNGFVTPGGGIFSGAGVTGNNFDPSLVSVGLTTIVYDYTNNYHCASTDSFQLRIDNCTGIADVENEILLSIFPNPGKQNFNLRVHVNSIQHAELIITDAVGKICIRKNQLLEPNKPIIALQLPQLAPGIYSVQLKGEKGSAVKSLVVEEK